MVKIYITRHGEKLYSTSDGDIKWKKSNRYKSNIWDVPLTNKGKYQSSLVGDELINIGFSKEMKYIYSSPMTRCIETAIEIAKKVGKKIRIEYGFAESLLGNVGFKGDDVVNTYKYTMNDGKKYYNTIDRELCPDKLIEKYGEYLDKDYKSVIKHDDLGQLDEFNYVKRMFKSLKNVKKDNCLIVAHGRILYYCYLYFNQRGPIKDIGRLFFGNQNVNKLVGYEQYDKNKWKVIYKPNNNFSTRGQFGSAYINYYNKYKKYKIKYIELKKPLKSENC